MTLVLAEAGKNIKNAAADNTGLIFVYFLSFG